MIDLENKIERDKLIDDYFNKGYACDIREVYQAVVNTIADLEYANDEKIKEIERLNKMLDEKFMKENTFLVENGIICTKNKEIERLNKARKFDIEYNKYLQKEIIRLNNIINEFDKLIKNEINESKLEDDYERVDSLEYCLATLKELKGENNE